MKLAVLSDLHCDTFQSIAWLSDLAPPSGVDDLILAGDVATKNTQLYLESIAIMYKRVLYTPGNHEYWHTSPEAVQDMLVRLPSNVRCGVPYTEGTFPDGTTYLCGPLWYSAPDDHLRALNFDVRNGVRPGFIYGQHQALVRRLVDGAPVDLVVTHHLPSFRFVQPRWYGSPINCFFASDVLERMPWRPQVWVFGHTHSVIDVVYDGCRFVCNPRGYPGEDVPHKHPTIVEIQPRRNP